MRITWEIRRTIAIMIWCIMLMMFCTSLILLLAVDAAAVTYHIAMWLSITGLHLSAYLVSFCSKCRDEYKDFDD